MRSFKKDCQNVIDPLLKIQTIFVKEFFKPALSNLVANRHMWRQALLMRHFHFYIHFDKNNSFKGITLK